MKNIILIAPPAAGKGTQSDLLVEKYNYAHISTGNLLRSAVLGNNNLNNEISAIIKSGNLVPDDIVTKLLQEKLKSTSGPYIFDGYPRNIKQAENLERILSTLNIDLGKVIYLDLKKEDAIKRATGRAMCSKCNKIYNNNFEKFSPAIKGKCDICNGNLITRADDTINAYNIRYDIYSENVLPLLDYYNQREKLYTIDVSLYPEETFNKIEEVIL